MRRARILLVDDHAIVREGLRLLLAQTSDYEICGEASDVTSAVDTARRVGPDVAIVDLALQGASGLELIKLLRAEFPELPILVLSMHDEPTYAERAFRAGALGYVRKAEAPEILVRALRRVMAGRLYLSGDRENLLLSVLKYPGTSERGVEQLSDRELEVFRLLGHGHGTRKIAEVMHVSVKTIEAYRARIKEKLAIDNASLLVKRAVEWTHLGR